MMRKVYISPRVWKLFSFTKKVRKTKTSRV